MRCGGGSRPKSPRLHRAAHREALYLPDALQRARAWSRHLDLRPFILSGDQPYVTEGGLARSR